MDEVSKEYLDMIKAVAKVIDAGDPYMHGHCDKVMKYSLAICRRLKLARSQISTIRNASLLHDIGKMGIDSSILRKAGALTGRDWKKVRLHPEIGAKIVGEGGLLKEEVPIIKYHHARYDGSGYPVNGRRDGDIPLGARIIAVADAFDAMTSNRPYRKAMTRQEAINELRRCSGSQFDPDIVKAFLER